ncbi:hypothetical protein PR048_013659 [Dryococelus australis]|uniref:Uncharacterized protein n=1 Tax=Dryococelus australis TaxID=614101 RepID=A0ABQ9HST2_9NEOP|nr:hypothetical protein PR048_013659 [Dryococelus australis]
MVISKSICLVAKIRPGFEVRVPWASGRSDHLRSSELPYLSYASPSSPPLTADFEERLLLLGDVVPGFLHVGIVSDDATGRWVFSGISRLPRPFIPAMLHIHFASPTSAHKMSMLRAA